MTDSGSCCDTRPIPAAATQAVAQIGIKAHAHLVSVAKFYELSKQHFATAGGKTAPMDDTPKKPANQILSEALEYFMNPYWSNVSLAQASGVAEGTIRNYRTPEKRGQGKSGKEPSAKVTELEAIANAMGLLIIDLLEDMSVDKRKALHRQRAAEYYQRKGVLPPWAPGADDDEPEPASAQGRSRKAS